MSHFIQHYAYDYRLHEKQMLSSPLAKDTDQDEDGRDRSEGVANGVGNVEVVDIIPVNVRPIDGPGNKFINQDSRNTNQQIDHALSREFPRAYPFA